MNYHPMQDDPSYPASYWLAIAPEPPKLSSLESDLDVDLAIIGGGFAGLSTALHAALTGLSVVVLEANRPGWGASGRNNGQVVAELKHEPHQVRETFGAERGDRLIETVGKGPDLVFSLVERYQMDCRPIRTGIVTAANDDHGLNNLKRRVEVWSRNGAPLEVLSRDRIRSMTGSDYYIGGCIDPRGGSVNPLAYVFGLATAALAEGATIHERTPVTGLEKNGDRWLLTTPKGKVAASRVVMATNAYTGNLGGKVKRTFLPIRTPQVVTKPLPEEIRKRILPGGQPMSDTRHPVVGVRMHPDGRMHLGGKIGNSKAENAEHFKILQAEVPRLFPDIGPLEWEYTWSGWVAMSPSLYPSLYELAPGLVAVAGYSGRGIAMATTMGRDLGEWAAGKRALDDMTLPLSSPHTIPYYDLRSVLVDINMFYHRSRERIGHALASS